ncbi:hypothetical protein MVLG_03068 [Microbotryum lychnidis-dioicae p1A1 Lamole]|uniref:Uncharacterized protein n=1 Tax=Microbotryum lychnidis-dioicae (strain p1A1 Lamole / MvSl-1064) TaxID=683840 RepID=U5H728_USTV1|nr:hypothetical protein MVLG_03068 [Microbotryum lychnidis-dioicae p1A1 Lamole]|eukprot:KDE06571.1 hypothetical protein MVLG_03068 [Microbotryum lychnidis-dioicae p1A1 Lamole]
MPYQQPITPSCGSDLVPTFTHFSGIQSNLVIQNANPILHQQRLANNASTPTEANITNNSPTREGDESGGSPSKRGRLTHHARLAYGEGSLVSSVMGTKRRVEEGLSIDQ